MSTVTSTSASSRRIGEQIRYWLPAVVVFGLGIAAWQWLLPDVLGVEEFLLPRFSDVVQALVDERDKLLRGAWITFKEAFGGFVLGSGAAVVAALVLARWRPFGNALMPYMIAAGKDVTYDLRQDRDPSKAATTTDMTDAIIGALAA